MDFYFAVSYIIFYVPHKIIDAHGYKVLFFDNALNYLTHFSILFFG